MYLLLKRPKVNVFHLINLRKSISNLIVIYLKNSKGDSKTYVTISFISSFHAPHTNLLILNENEQQSLVLREFSCITPLRLNFY